MTWFCGNCQGRLVATDFGWACPRCRIEWELCPHNCRAPIRHGGDHHRYS